MVDWQEARGQFAPCRRGIVYLNTGALGLISDPVLQAETTWKLFVNEHGRASKTVLDRFENGFETSAAAAPGAAWAGIGDLRERLAQAIHAVNTELYFTAGTSDSIARAIAAVKWNPGDHILITDAEHATVLANARDAATEHPITVDLA